MNDKIKWTLEQAMNARDRITNIIELLEGLSAQGGEETPRAGTWISVIDRLPREGETVLAFFSKRDKVTYWMPLPEPPEEI